MAACSLSPDCNSPPRPRCLHCRTPRAHKCRGLCHRCWERPDVRRRYPKRRPAPPPARAEGPLPHETARHYAAPLPACPTAALPRTPDKIDVLANRRRLGKTLFHPEDRAGRDPDYVALWDKILEAVAGVFWSENCYRASPRLPGTGRHGGRRVELGRFRTRAAAAWEVLRWSAAGQPETWEKREGPVRVRPAPPGMGK